MRNFVCVCVQCIFAVCIEMCTCTCLCTRAEFSMRKHQAIFYKMLHLQLQKKRIRFKDYRGNIQGVTN